MNELDKQEIIYDNKKIQDDQNIEKEVLKYISYINFKLLNTLILQNKQEKTVVLLFKALLTIFQGTENWIPKNIKDWSAIQRTIGHTSRFIQMLQNFKKYYIPEQNINQAENILSNIQPIPTSVRGNNLYKIVASLIQYYNNPFNKTLHEDSQLTSKFYNEPPLSPIRNQNLIEQDSEIMQDLIKTQNKTCNTQIDQKQNLIMSKLRSRSPTTASSGSKSRTVQSCQNHRLSIPISDQYRQQSNSQKKQQLSNLQLTLTSNYNLSLKSSGIYFRERSSTNAQNNQNLESLNQKKSLKQLKQPIKRDSLFTKKTLQKSNK